MKPLVLLGLRCAPACSTKDSLSSFKDDRSLDGTSLDEGDGEVLHRYSCGLEGLVNGMNPIPSLRG